MDLGGVSEEALICVIGSLFLPLSETCEELATCFLKGCGRAR